MRSDPYSDFAAVYDRWQWLHAAPFSTAMILRMEQARREWGVPERSLLDLACGTGTLAWWWLERHPDWHVTGVDRSPAMIEQARSGTGRHSVPGRGGRRRREVPRPEGGRTPDFRVGDMTRLQRDRRFGMVTCFFDSLNHVTRRQDLLRVLRGARQALHPHGLFLFDLIDEDSFAEIFSSPWIVHDPGLYVGTESELFHRRGGEFGRVRFTFFERATEGQGRGARSAPTWIRHDAEILERCWRREEFDPMVESAGLEVIHVQLIDPEEQAEVFVPRRLYVCRPR